MNRTTAPHRQETPSRDRGRGGRDVTYRFGAIGDENHTEIPRFAEIRCFEKRCGEEIDVLLAIATGV